MWLGVGFKDGFWTWRVRGKFCGLVWVVAGWVGVVWVSVVGVEWVSVV